MLAATPGGIWVALAVGAVALGLARPLVAAPNLLGVSVADFNPDGDADGTYAAYVVEGLASLFAR